MANLERLAWVCVPLVAWALDPMANLRQVKTREVMYLVVKSLGLNEE